MWKYISDNYKWLFSGIGVVVVAGLCGFVCDYATDSTNEGDSSSVIAENPEHKAARTDSAVGLVRKLTPQSIEADIANAPLLHQKEIALSYRGLKVNWSGTVGDIEPDFKDSEHVRVYLMVGPDASFVHFALDVTDHPGLGTLRQGDSMHVFGTIEEASNRRVELINATATF